MNINLLDMDSRIPKNTCREIASNGIEYKITLHPYNLNVFRIIVKSDDYMSRVSNMAILASRIIKKIFRIKTTGTTGYKNILESDFYKNNGQTFKFLSKTEKMNDFVYNIYDAAIEIIDNTEKSNNNSMSVNNIRFIKANKIKLKRLLKQLIMLSDKVIEKNKGIKDVKL